MCLYAPLPPPPHAHTHQVYSINDLANFEAGMGETIGTASGSSGAGLTRLEPRTIAREIKKVELIGKCKMIIPQN